MDLIHKEHKQHVHFCCVGIRGKSAPVLIKMTRRKGGWWKRSIHSQLLHYMETRSTVFTRVIHAIA